MEEMALESGDRKTTVYSPAASSMRRGVVASAGRSIPERWSAKRMATISAQGKAVRKRNPFPTAAGLDGGSGTSAAESIRGAATGAVLAAPLAVTGGSTFEGVEVAGSMGAIAGFEDQ
jgi:hypothetical protein